MAWSVEFTPAAAAKLNEISSTNARRILKFLHERIANRDDTRSTGKALVGSEFGGLWRYRVGDYRILCRIEDEKICILIIEIGHRREVYKQ